MNCLSRFTTVVALMLAATLPAAAADLTISVEGVGSADGQVLIALFDSADSFRVKPVRAAVAPATPGTVTVQIRDLPAGDYAFALYHDANANNKLDTNAVGMPIEDYAFSNNALGKRGAPSYEQARFHVPDAGTVAVVNLR